MRGHAAGDASCRPSNECEMTAHNEDDGNLAVCERVFYPVGDENGYHEKLEKVSSEGPVLGHRYNMPCRTVAGF